MLEPVTTLRTRTHNPNETRILGAALGKELQAGFVVCLNGDLGSGKTCLTQGIAKGLCVSGVVNSPTFVFINEYTTRENGLCLYHVDLYRIQNSLDALALGLEDYMYGNGVTVIEWPERAIDLLPEECLWVHLTYVDDQERQFVIKAVGERYIKALKAFLDSSQDLGLTLETLDADSN